MSARNLFLIKLYKDEEGRYIYNQLYEYMKNNKFGIKFEPKNYYDEILKLLNCNRNYFIVTDDKKILNVKKYLMILTLLNMLQHFPRKNFKQKKKSIYIIN